MIDEDKLKDALRALVEYFGDGSLVPSDTRLYALLNEARDLIDPPLPAGPYSVRPDNAGSFVLAAENGKPICDILARGDEIRARETCEKIAHALTWHDDLVRAAATCYFGLRKEDTKSISAMLSRITGHTAPYLWPTWVNKKS